MEFKDYYFLSEIMSKEGLDCGRYNIRALGESSSWPSIKKGILAGTAAAGLLAPFAYVATKTVQDEKHDSPANLDDTKWTSSPVEITDRTRERYERQKDNNRYYDLPTTQELVKMAEQGDEWATREIAWPKGHKLHEKGRPFFRNKGPHPDGLKFYSGFKGD